MSDNVVYDRHKIKKSWEMVARTQYGEGVPDGAGNKNKGKGARQNVNRVVVIHEDRKNGVQKEREMRKDNKNSI